MHKRKNKYQANKFFHEKIRYKIRTQKPEDEQKSQYMVKQKDMRVLIQSSFPSQSVNDLTRRPLGLTHSPSEDRKDKLQF